ncbi:MAG: hypothetical protein U1E16_01350 [Hyphomicrobiales bacterium]
MQDGEAEGAGIALAEMQRIAQPQAVVAADDLEQVSNRIKASRPIRFSGRCRSAMSIPTLSASGPRLIWCCKANSSSRRPAVAITVWG